MSKPSLRSLALGFFLSAIIVFSYTTFFYKTPVADSSVATDKKKENAEEEETYKQKYEELLVKTEVNEKKDSSESTATKDSSDVEKKEVEAKKEEQTPKEEAAKEITLVINPGEPSSNAIQKLADEKIIKSGEEFTQFLSDNDYETLVRDGSYKVNSKMTYDEIAKIITQSN